MNVSELKVSIDLCKRAGVTIYLWGERGIGKSSGAKQFAVENEIGFVDMRCSQMEASDLRGMPDRVDGRTVFLPPADLPDPEDTVGGILLLDELNRAEDDVIQAAFQLVLDRRVGQYKLPDCWGIVCAGNFGKGYNVNNFTDAAWIDRFCHVTLNARTNDYLGDWVQYMQNTLEDPSRIIQYTSASIENLAGEPAGQLDFSITPSPRSWEAVARIQAVVDKAPDKYPRPVLLQVLSGLIGTDQASAYMSFSCSVHPRDVIEQGMKAVGAAVRELSRSELVGLVWGVVSWCNRDSDTPMVLDFRNNALDFLEHVVGQTTGKDLAVMMASKLVQNESIFGSATVSNPSVAKFALNQNFADKDSWLSLVNNRKKLQGLLKDTLWGDPTAR